LPLKKALKLAKRENAALLIATIKDGTVHTHKTENFDRFLQQKE
jgi:hypothetical protein